jgi:hypothetical protein
VNAKVANNLNVMVPLNPHSEEGLILYFNGLTVSSDFLQSHGITFGRYIIDAFDIKIYSVLMRENNHRELAQVLGLSYSLFHVIVLFVEPVPPLPSHR